MQLQERMTGSNCFATVLLPLLAFGGEALAARPRIVARNDGVEVTGLPAVSADREVIAHLEPFEASSDADLVAVVFLRVADGTATDRFLVQQHDDDGRLLPPPSDGRGATPWRRARELTLGLERRGFRPLASIGETTWDRDPTQTIRGEGLRISQRRYQVTVRDDRDGRARWTGRLREMVAFCGMSDEHPRSVPPRVQNGWIDLASGAGLLEYGHVYASCMCPSDLAYSPFVLSP